MENGSDFLLSIDIKTWNKDTEDLYDFEGKDIIQSSIKLGGNSSEFFLIKTNNSIIKISSLKDLSFQNSLTKLFCHVIPSPKNHFDILSHYASSNIHWLPEDKVEDIWLKLSKTEYTYLKVGDIIKMGRVRIKLTTVHPFIPNYDNANLTSINNNCDNTTYNQIKVSATMANELTDSKIQKDMCRICYRTDSDYENPLIAPCKCTGSMKYIHFKCLQSAIASKFILLQNNNFTLITWKNHECEICLSEYPKYMLHKSKTYPMIDYSFITYLNYIIFDYFIYDDAKFKANRKGILIINIEQKSKDDEITIGRTQNNQVKLKNISVSRVHCSLKIENGNVMIKDNGSKFGTLLYLQQKFTLITNKDNESMSNITNQNYFGSSCIISSGRIAINFQLTKSRNFFLNLFNFGCCKNKTMNDSDCVIDLNNDESDNDDIANKKLLKSNIYNDHILQIDTIPQSIDNSP